MFFTGKSSETGEMDLMEDFPEESRLEEGNQTTFDLFDDECVEVGEVNEVGDLHTLTGLFNLFDVYFCVIECFQKKMCLGSEEYLGT